MRRAKGPRPWPVHLFAFLHLASGLWTYLSQMWTVAQQSDWFRTDLPDGLDRDIMIVVLSAQFTIVLIPVIAVWVFASRIARWIITALSLWSLVWWAEAMWSWQAQMSAAEGVISVASALPIYLAWLLLFTPSANRWFKTNRTPEVEIFE